MYRTELSFLKAMFKDCSLKDYRILIVNQTSDDEQLVSHSDRIRVINTTERGLSKSRNMAIANARAKLCLIADDDVIYLKGFGNTIVEAFNIYKDSGFISFKTIVDTKGTAFRNYVDKPKQLQKSQLGRILSIEMAFKRQPVTEHNIRFNEWFGLGAKFPNMSNQFFVKDLFDAGVVFHEVPKPIVLHQPESSSDEIATDRILYTRGAIFYKKYGVFAYFYVAKYAFFMIRKDVVSLKQLPQKLNQLQRGITDYRQLLKQGLDSR